MRQNISIMLVFVLLFFSFLLGCSMNSDTNSEEYSQIFIDNDMGDTLSGIDFNNGAGPYIIPSGHGVSNGANIKITAVNNYSSVVILALKFSSESNIDTDPDVMITLQPGEKIITTYLINLIETNPGTNFRVWQDSTKGADNLTDVTVYADVLYWLFNVVAAN